MCLAQEKWAILHLDHHFATELSCVAKNVEPGTVLVCKQLQHWSCDCLQLERLVYAGCQLLSVDSPDGCSQKQQGYSSVTSLGCTAITFFALTTAVGKSAVVITGDAVAVAIASSYTMPLLQCQCC